MQSNHAKTTSPRGEWIGGTGKERWFRVPLGEGVLLNLGQEFNGGVIEALIVRGDSRLLSKPVDVRVYYANADIEV